MSFGQHVLALTLAFGVFLPTCSAWAEDFVTYEKLSRRRWRALTICRRSRSAQVRPHGLPVKTKPEATYHLGGQALTAIIATDTDWSTSRFTIDDTKAENHRKSLFEVRSLLKPEKLPIERLAGPEEVGRAAEARLSRRRHQQRHQAIHPPRRNRNSGTAQRDCFILRQDGSIEGDIDWNYEKISRVEARPIDEKRLVLRGGVFTTVANQMKQEVGYNYWVRNIAITRSNTEVDGLTHHVVGETEVGHPYSGFLAVSNCANVTLRNCIASRTRPTKRSGPRERRSTWALTITPPIASSTSQ